MADRQRVFQRRLLYDVAHVLGQFDSDRMPDTPYPATSQRLLWFPGVAGRDFPPIRKSPRTSTIGSYPLMSTILFDYLMPLLGPEQASYWAQVFMVNPR